MAVNVEGSGALLGGVVVLVMAIFLPIFLRYLVDNAIATLGPEALAIHGVIGTRTIRYDRIVSLEIETMSAEFFAQRYLTIRCADQTCGQSHIAECLLEKKSAKLDAVIAAVNKVRRQAAPKAKKSPGLDLPSRARRAPELNPKAAKTQGIGR